MNIADELAAQVLRVRNGALANDIENALLDFARVAMKMTRDALRSDESVERVARAIHKHDADTKPMWIQDWDDLVEVNQEDLRVQARAAITALIGEE